jgi:WD40 repeat protein
MARDPIVIPAHGRHAHAVEFTRDGKTLVTVGQDTHVRLWSVPEWESSGTFEGHAKSVYTIALSPDEDLLATGSSDATVRIWSFGSGEALRVLSLQSGGVFSTDGTRLATLSVRGGVVLWEARSGRELVNLTRLDHRIFALAFTADGGTLLAGGTGVIHRVQAANGAGLGTLDGHEVAVACLRLSPDGRILASSGADRAVRLWSTEDWSEIRRIDLEAGGILQVAFSPDGRRLAVGADHLILVHDVDSGALVERIELQPKGVYGLAYSPDGRYLANAAADGKVRIWEQA